MKKALSLILALAMMLTMLVGCGDKNDSNNDANNDSQTEDLKWPEKDINILLGYGAGGDSDVCTRYMADALSKELGVNVVVTNMGGANASLAANEIMNSTDPEYNFLAINTASLSANPATGLTDYNYEALDAISIFSSYSGEVLLVRSDAPYTTLQEFVDYAKENTVIMGVAMGGALYAAASAMKAAGLKLEIVDCTFASYSSSRDYVENGDFLELATLCAEPIPAAPDMPCVCDVLDGVIVNTKFCLMAQKGTNPAILQKINDALQHIYETNEEYVKNVEDYSYQSAKPMTIEETLAELETQYQTFQGYKQYLG